jgi:hypothetical protein
MHTVLASHAAQPSVRSPPSTCWVLMHPTLWQMYSEHREEPAAGQIIALVDIVTDAL